MKEITNAINKESEIALAIKYYRLTLDLEKASQKLATRQNENPDPAEK